MYMQNIKRKGFRLRLSWHQINLKSFLGFSIHSYQEGIAHFFMQFLYAITFSVPFIFRHCPDQMIITHWVDISIAASLL